MADHPMRRDRIAGDQVSAQMFDRSHLRVGEPMISPFVAGIDDFDPEGNGIEVAFALPTRDPRVEGSPVLGDEPPDHAVFFDKIMRADMGVGIAQPLQRRRCSSHAGIVEHQHIDPRRFGTGAMVRREALDYLRLDHCGRASRLAIWS